VNLFIAFRSKQHAVDGIAWTIGLAAQVACNLRYLCCSFRGLVGNSELVPVVLCGQVAPAGVELWCSIRCTGRQGRGQSHADRDVCERSTDTLKEAPPRTRATSEPPTLPGGEDVSSNSIINKICLRKT